MLSDIEMFLKSTNNSEQMIIKKYMQRHNYLYTFVCMSFVATILLFIFAPFFTDSMLPADAWYPFSMDKLSVRSLLYFLQCIVICQTGLHIFVDLMVATLLWYSTSRLDFLNSKLKEINNNEELVIYIKKHQNITL